MYNSGSYGKIKFKLKQILEDEKISKNYLSTKSGVRFDTIQRYIKGDIVRVDLDIVCKLCNSLNCNIEDIIEYKN